MRKLKLETQISVDGFVADAEGRTDWMVWNWGKEWTWDPALQKYHTDLTSSVDCILLSRKMAEEGFINHWKKTAENKQDPQYEFAKHITDTHKIVFSKTLKKSEWENTEIAKDDLITEINTLKRKNGKDIIAYGGASFVSSLIGAGLIDEYHLVVNPTAIGNGKPIFRELNSKMDLRLVKAASYDHGIVVLHYVPAERL
jgi:dihydrofolate reductase